MADLITIDDKIAAIEDVIAARDREDRRDRRLGRASKHYHRFTPALKAIAKDLHALRKQAVREFVEGALAS